MAYVVATPPRATDTRYSHTQVADARGAAQETAIPGSGTAEPRNTILCKPLTTVGGPASVQEARPRGTETAALGWEMSIARKGAGGVGDPELHAQQPSPSSSPFVNPSLSESSAHAPTVQPTLAPGPSEPAWFVACLERINSPKAFCLGSVDSRSPRLGQQSTCPNASQIAAPRQPAASVETPAESEMQGTLSALGISVRYHRKARTSRIRRASATRRMGRGITAAAREVKRRKEG